MAVNTQQEAINYLVKKYPFIKEWNISVSEVCSKDAQVDKLKWNFSVSIIDPNNSDGNASFQSSSEEDLTEALRDIDRQLKVVALLKEKEIKSRVK